MKYIINNGLKCHWNFWLLPKSFGAITLFGHIFFNSKKSKEQLEEFLDTYRGKVVINHERIHVLQAESFKTRYFGFYAYYLWYWFIGLFKYGIKDHASYRHIPFEQEAYNNEYDFSYDKTNWRLYI